MYVCSCNALTDRELRAASRGTARPTAKAAFRALGCRFDCGQCLRRAHKIARETHPEFHAAVMMAAE